MVKAETIIEGRQYIVRLRVERDYSTGEAPYPGWYGMDVPVQILAEYPRFYVCKVLPHKCRVSFGISSSYTVTIDKWDIEMGVFKIYER